MATLSERLALIIDFDGKQAIKGLEGVAKKSEGADKSTRDLSANLSKMGAIGLASAGVAAAGLGKLAMGASDLNEVTSKTKVIFGDAADEVIKFGKDAAKNLGMSEAAALGAATQVAGLGKAAGLSGVELGAFSTDLVTLAGDLASFNNTSPEDAINAIGAALRGEAEPIRAYNVLLDDATLKNRALSMGLIETTTGTLPPAIKTQAAYKEILEQTKDAQGDFARTSEGAANQQRILKAELKNLSDGIGTGVLPAFTGIVTLGADVIGKLNEMGPAAQKTLGTLAAGGTGVVAAVSGISLIAGQLVKMKERFIEVGDASSYFTTAGKVAIGASVGVGVLAVAMQAVQDRAAAAQKRVDDLKGSMKELGVTAEQAATRKLLELISTTDRFDTAMLGAGLSTEDLAKAIGGTSDEYGRAQSALEDYRRKLQTTGQQTSAGYKESIQLSAALREQRTAIAGVAEEERKAAEVKARENEISSKANITKGEAARLNAVLKSSVEDATPPQEDFNDAIKLSGELADDAAKSQGELSDAITGVWESTQASLDPTFAYHQALRDVADGADDVKDKTAAAAKATKEHGADSREAAKANRELNGAQEQLAKDIQVASLRLLEQNGTVEGSKAAYDTQIQSIKDLRATYGTELGPIGVMLDELELKLRRAAQQAANLSASARIIAGGGAGYNGVGGGSSTGGPRREGGGGGGVDTGAFTARAPMVVNVTIPMLKPSPEAGQAILDSIRAAERLNGPR